MKQKAKYKSKKKYTVIVKTGNADFKKWKVNNLLKFVSFLDKQYKDWRWFNVFCNKEKNQLASFTKSYRPIEPYI